MKKIILVLSQISLTILLLIAVFYRRGLVSNPIGQFTGFPINHQQTGWGTSLYYPLINPEVEVARDIKVGIIDSGIAQNLEDEFYLEKQVSFSDSKNVNDQLGHGTKIASIIAAKNNHKWTLGLAPSAKIYSYKVVDDDGAIKESYIIRALKQAKDDGVDLVNFSMVVKNLTPELETAVNDYLQTGGYFITPAYDLKNLDVLNPLTSIDGVIAVGSFNDFFKILNPQEDIDYYAPYTQETLSPNLQIIRSDGSSFSTAFVSGTIANFLSQSKSRTQIDHELQTLFSQEAVTRKRQPLLVFYETYREEVDLTYSVLGIGSCILIVVEVFIGLGLILRNKSKRKYYLAQLSVQLLVLILIAWLTLPTQM